MQTESASAPTEYLSPESAGPHEIIIRHLFEASLGSGNLTVAHNALAPDYMGHVAGMPDLPPGPAGFKRFVTRLRRAVFDLDVRIDDVVARDTDVMVHWTASGRHERPFLGVEPTCVVGDVGQEPGGKQVTLSAITIAQISGSRLQESRTEWTSPGFD